jgi:hypothetical protein
LALEADGRADPLRLRCIEYPISRPFCRNKVLDLAIAEKQFGATVAALQEVGTLAGLRIELREVGRPGELRREDQGENPDARRRRG